MADKERIKRLASTLKKRKDAKELVKKSKKSLFDKGKIADRIPADGGYPGGTSGVVDAVRHYLSNDDNYVGDRIRDAMDDASRGVLDPESLSQMLAHEDAKRIYLGMPQVYGSFEPSPYRPTIGSMDNPYQLNGLLSDSSFENTILPMYATWKTGKDWPLYDTKSRVTNLGKTAQLSDFPYLHRAGMSEGFDDNGQYISLQDTWDYNTAVKGKSGDNVGKWIGGKPFDIYQRYYLDDWLDIPDDAKGNPYIAPSYIEADYTGSRYVPDYTFWGLPQERGEWGSTNEFGCGGKIYPGGGKFLRTNLQNEVPLMYNPMPPTNYPIEIPFRFRPQPDLGDWRAPTSTGMMVNYPIPVPREAVVEVPAAGYGVSLPVDVPSVSVLDPRRDAARRIMAVENSKASAAGGWDAKTGRWYPHKSIEGGADTIAYGIKLSNGTPEAALALKQGYLTDEQAVSAVDSLVQKYYDAAKRVYDGKYGAGEWDKLSDKSQSILVDYSYNPGLAKFPKLMEGFHSGDLDLIRKNYKRYSGRKELGRNKVLLEELDTLENEYPIFRSNGGKLFADGGPELNSGWNAGASIINRIKQKVQDVKEKYLSDYADSGYVYSYPSNPVELMKYAISPYAKTDEYGDMMLRNMPEEVTNARRALFAKNFQIDIGDKAYSDAIVESRYKPTKSSDDNAKYYTIPIDDVNTRFKYLTHIVGSSNIAPGEDEHGKYISMYDIWDLAPFSGEGNDFKNSKPVEIYDRFYESEAPDIYNSYSTPGLDAHLPNSGMAAYSSGGKIHIKPENRGKFTALKKRTGHSASWFKAHGTPAQKKMAVFALNSRKWKHGDGGPIDRYSPEHIRAAIAKLKETRK